MLDRARITVINDDPDFLAMVGDVLTEERYVVTLIDGEDESEPTERIAASDPDLLIIDLRLGSDDLRGWQLMQSVRATPRFGALPVLVCSGDVRAIAGLADDIAMMRNAASLTKPFGVDELDGAVANLLARGGEAH